MVILPKQEALKRKRSFQSRKLTDKIEAPFPSQRIICT